MNIIDRFLNNITMYKLVLYGLLLMVVFSFALSFIGLLSYSPLSLFINFMVITTICFVGNILIARLFRATINFESSIITGLILYFLIWPYEKPADLLLIAAVAIISIASKYILAYKKKHIFNPAAVACVLLLFFGSGALWWIGTAPMVPITLIVGLLIVRKIRRFTMLFTFLGASLGVFVFHALLRGLAIPSELYTFFTSFPTVFFATIMFTEPLTTPPTRRLQMIYATIVGVLFAWQEPLGPIIMTTELTLVIGNVFSFIVSPKHKLYLHLSGKKEIAKDTYEFSFPKPAAFNFKPGQYLEWTLPITKPDLRGNRRYFTISSSPTENVVTLGIKFNDPSSNFKSELWKLDGKKTVVAGQLAGDFTMPTDKSKKLVFVAGGIGVTPFRSMVNFLRNTREKRDIIFFYANKNEREIAYKGEFDSLQSVGVKMVYLLSDKETLPTNWNGEVGRLNEELVKKYVPDYPERQFYISGPSAMVTSYKKLLNDIGVRQTSITTDYFPGF